MKIAIIGCGYSADYYLQTMPLHPELELVGVYDKNAERQRQFVDCYRISGVNSLDEILNGPAEIILNITNPDSHYAVSKACLEAGKHVYSEKPLGMSFHQAKELFEISMSKGLLLVCAPCSILGESAQTMWKALRNKVIGDVYAVYAEMDDGLVSHMPHRRWRSRSGAPWPSKDEFEVGCTLEHAGYVLPWLCAMFGPATNVTAFGSTTIADKKTDEPLNRNSPDLSVACVRFSSGVVARLTCSIVAQHNHQIRIFGEKGILGTNESKHYRSPVWIKRIFSIRRRMIVCPWKKKLRLAGQSNPRPRHDGSACMDFCRGPAEMANSLNEQRPCRLSPQISLHVNELALALHEAGVEGTSRKLTTTFEPIDPMPWAV